MDEPITAANEGGLHPEPSNPGGLLEGAASAADAGKQETDSGSAGSESGKPGNEEAAKTDPADAGKAEGKEKDDSSGSGSETEKPADKPDDQDEEQKKLESAWEAFAGQLDPSAGLAKELVDDFAKAARENGLNPEQAKSLVDWQIDLCRREAEKLRRNGLESLRKEWGRDTESRLNRSLELVTFIDRQLPDSPFSKVINKFGISNHPDFVRGLDLLARQLGEDSLASIHDGAASAWKEESILEGIRNAMKGK